MSTVTNYSAPYFANTSLPNGGFLKESTSAPPLVLVGDITSTSPTFADLLALTPELQTYNRSKTTSGIVSQMSLVSAEFSRNPMLQNDLVVTEASLASLLSKAHGYVEVTDTASTLSRIPRKVGEALCGDAARQSAVTVQRSVSKTETLPLAGMSERIADLSSILLDRMNASSAKSEQHTKDTSKLEPNSLTCNDLPNGSDNVSGKAITIFPPLKDVTNLQREKLSGLLPNVVSGVEANFGAPLEEHSVMLVTELTTNLAKEEPQSVFEKTSATPFDRGDLLGHATTADFSKSVLRSQGVHGNFSQKFTALCTSVTQLYSSRKTEQAQTVDLRWNESEAASQASNCALQSGNARSSHQKSPDIDGAAHVREKTRPQIKLNSGHTPFEGMMGDVQSADYNSVLNIVASPRNSEKFVKSYMTAAFANATRSTTIHVAVQNIESELKIITRAGRLTDLDRKLLVGDIITLMAQNGLAVRPEQIQIGAPAAREPRGSRS